MTKDTFGESLKREREMRGVTLEEVSAATRIATRFLRAIEDEKWEQLPGGVFNRGFVRAVARYLGLDEENTVAEYTLAVGDRQTVPVWTGRPPAVTPDQPWLAWIIAAIIVIALGVGGWFGARQILQRRAQRKNSSSLLDAASSATGSSVASALTTRSVLAEPSIPESTTAPISVAVPASAAPPASGEVSKTVLAAALVPDVPSDHFELKVATSKRTKVVVVADQDVVFDGTMKASQNHFFNATDHFQVSAKDAGVVQLELNGKPIAPIGPAGQEGKITLTRQGLKIAAGGAN